MDFFGTQEDLIANLGCSSASNQDCSKRRDTTGNDATILFRWVLLSAAIEVLKVRSDACGPLEKSPDGIFKDVRFSPHREFWPFLGPLVFSMFLLHNEFWPFLGLPLPLTFHKVNNDGQSIFWEAEGGPPKRKTRGNKTRLKPV